MSSINLSSTPTMDLPSDPRWNAIPNRAADPAPPAIEAVKADPTPVKPAETAAPQPAPVVIHTGNLQGSFEYDPDVQQVIVTLRREDDGQVVQQFPNEKIVRMLMSMMQELGKTLDVKG